MDSTKPPPPRYLLLAALFDELKVTIDRLGLRPDGAVYTGQPGQSRVIAAATGVGATRAKTTVNRLLDRYQPQQVVLVGFAGGLDPSLRSGTCLNITWVINEQGSTMGLAQSDQPDQDHLPGVPQPVAPTLPRHTQNSLLTADRLIHTPTAKHQRWTRCRCAAVDMETYHVAELLAQRRVPLTVRRVIYDSAAMALPRQAARWIRPDGQTNTNAVIRHLICRPWQVMPLLQLGRLARAAAQRLAQEVESIVREAPG